MKIKKPDTREVIEDKDVEVVEHPLNLNDVVRKPENYSDHKIQDFIMEQLCPNINEFQRYRVRNFLNTIAKTTKENLDDGKTLREDWFGDPSKTDTAIQFLQRGLQSILR